jgi:hypothetical protein
MALAQVAPGALVLAALLQPQQILQAALQARYHTKQALEPLRLLRMALLGKY